MLATIASASGAPNPSYRQVDSWSAPDAPWDYASVDARARRLYIGRFGGVLAVDLTTKAVTPMLIRSALVHGVAPLPDGETAAASNGPANTVAFFNGKTGAVGATVPVGKEPDSIVYEPRYGLLAVTDEDGGDVSLVDVKTLRLVGRVPLGGSPEAVVADGDGRLYDNIDDRREIAVIDVAKRGVIRRIALPGCDRPTGIAYDEVKHVIISACRNGVVNTVAARSGRVVTTLHLGAGPDAVMSDARRGVAFVPSGATGVLNVLAIADNGGATLVQTVPTQVGSRTGAVDPVTGNVYIPAAKLRPSSVPGQPHALEPGSFHILVYARR